MEEQTFIKEYPCIVETDAGWRIKTSNKTFLMGVYTRYLQAEKGLKSYHQRVRAKKQERQQKNNR